MSCWWSDAGPSPYSAQLAGRLGRPHVFALQFVGAAVRLYRESFRRGGFTGLYIGWHFEILCRSALPTSGHGTSNAQPANRLQEPGISAVSSQSNTVGCPRRSA
jgi:hypothetical protein